jgi:uncharacterized protein (DUF1330 family)
MGSVNPSSEQIAGMMASAGDPSPINMINLIRFRAKADYPADHACAPENLTGEQAYRRYMAGTLPFLNKLNARVVWSGVPNLVVIGPADERWDMAFIVEYPSVAAMLSMIGDPEYQKVAVHRTAAVEDSHLIRCAPQAI